MSLDSKKIIGLVTWDFDEPKGGLGRAMQSLVESLEKSGFDVKVATPTRGFLSITKSIGGHLLFSLLLLFILRKWMRKNQISCLLYPVGPGGTFVPAVDCPTAAIVYHTYAQQSSLVPGQRWKKIFKLFEKRTLNRSTKLFCYADDTKNALIAAYRIPESNIQLVTQILNVDDWSAGTEKEKGLCICIARLEERKGVSVLLDAWEKVTNMNTDAHLLIVGRGIQSATIDRHIKKIGPSVKRLESVPQGELHLLLTQADLSICPSYLEGFGLTAAESALSGTTVVASDCDGLRSLVRHNDTGMLVPPGDPAALADAILSLLADQDFRSRLADAASREMRARFDRSRAEEELRSSVRALCSEGC